MRGLNALVELSVPLNTPSGVLVFDGCSVLSLVQCEWVVFSLDNEALVVEVACFSGTTNLPSSFLGCRPLSFLSSPFVGLSHDERLIKGLIC